MSIGEIRHRHPLWVGESVMLFWHVPAPNEALLISGSRRRDDETQFRIVTGHGTMVLPIKQKARRIQWVSASAW
jgi:uncharacterized membrane protein YqiK